MIYLSRLVLDPMARRVQKELAAPYEMHRTLCHAFPALSGQEWEAARVLFRADADKGENQGATVLLVQSKVAPDWASFADKVGARYLLASPQVKAWQPRFETGQTLRFRLQANPTYSPQVEGKRGQRRGLYREAERLDWLRRCGERLGFQLPLVSTTLCAQGDEGERIVFRGREHEELTLDLPVCEVTDLNGGVLQSEKARSHSDKSRRTLRAPMPLCPKEELSSSATEPRIAGFGSKEFSAARFDGTLRVSNPALFVRAVEDGIGKAKGFGFGLLSLAAAR